jgi:hypothetical protein
MLSIHVLIKILEENDLNIVTIYIYFFINFIHQWLYSPLLGLASS